LSFIYPIHNRSWRNISTIYIYNKTSIKRNILSNKIHREVGKAKDLRAPPYNHDEAHSRDEAGAEVQRQIQVWSFKGPL